MGQVADDSFTIKQNDDLPNFSTTLQDGNGNAVDLSSDTITFNMQKEGSTGLKIDAASVSITDAANGGVQYNWDGSTDTDVAGDFKAEFVRDDGTNTETYPSNGFITITIEEDLG
jgi:hypothetical protein